MPEYPDARETIAAAMSEDELQVAVDGRLRDYGWLSYHTRRSDKSPEGFPDVCAVRTGQLLFAELKIELPDPCTPAQRLKLSPTAAQERWLLALGVVEHESCRASGAIVRVYLWRPKDLLDGTIDEVLR